MSTEYTTYEKLILAIASMDAYNRGLAPSVQLDATNIGPLKFTKSSADLGIGNLATDGFAAVAYTVSGTGTSLDGKTIIAYRGTDNPTLATDPVKGASDILTGWIAALGEPNAQTQLAFDFYQAVTNQSVWADTTPSNVVLTGHSPGGGLAEYVGTTGQSTRGATDRGPQGGCPVLHGHDGRVQPRRCVRWRVAERTCNRPSYFRPMMMPRRVGGRAR
ncbi:Mbeg1-like protein [Pinisolibacter aquiterrae]|uniref:Mbeg1-like protein n=1 Tax=Pinisolibacter aquiterrae TaxID=2815579 RepID=UPI001C3CA8E0|nr:Mbeg1-like protein [Pinisolibacter aquiterrae]MBV5265382.1 hypothetical protein [Pinisolibacter aquiterrae]MCC8235241.1 DUF2974 domain-containing protein [Pinisolibacter aquiterrae]